VFLPVILGTSSLYVECLQTNPFPPSLTLPRAPVLCTLADALKARQTEYYTNTHPFNPVFRNYQTTPVFLLSPLSLSLLFSFRSLAIF